MSIDNVTIHQGYELPNGTNTLAHDVTRLINALTSVDSDVFLRPLASSSTYVGTTAIALNRASAAQALTGITSIDGSAATLTTSRTLWGQSFNGSANVTGNLTSVGNITGSGAISLTTAAASNLSLTSGTTGIVTIDSGTTGAVSIGTGANTKTITIGSSTGTVQLPTAVTKVGQTSLIQGGAVNVTFPTLAGTLVGSGDTGTVTATMLASTTGTGSTVVLSTLPTFGTTGVRFSGSTSGTTTLLASTTASGTLTLPAVTGTVVTTGDTGTVTSTMILDGTILDADVNASAAIVGTKISPNFGSQNVTTTGISTAASFIPTSATVPTNGIYLSAANTVALATNSTGRVFIDSSGRLLVGTNAPILGVACPLQVEVAANAAFFKTTTTGSDVIALLNAATTGDNVFVNFGTEAGFSSRGTIDYNRAAGQLRYNITSDQRLKSAIQPAPSALNLLSSIQVRSYTWTETGYTVNYGFIAQELHQVVPDAVKKGDDGEEVQDAWAVDNAKIVPVLTKALQEILTEIAILKNRVTVLEIT